LSKKQKYSKEFRIKIVKQYLEGQFTAIQLVDKYKIARASVYFWVDSYNINGSDIFVYVNEFLTPLDILKLPPLTYFHMSGA
jgi:hypothetical protein